MCVLWYGTSAPGWCCFLSYRPTMSWIERWRYACSRSFSAIPWPSVGHLVAPNVDIFFFDPNHRTGSVCQLRAYSRIITVIQHCNNYVIINLKPTHLCSHIYFYCDFHVDLNKLNLNLKKIQLYIFFTSPHSLPILCYWCFSPWFGLFALSTSLKAADVCACIQMLCVYRSQSHPFTKTPRSP